MRWYFVLSAVATAMLSAAAWAKSGPALHMPEDIARVRERCQAEEWAIEQRKNAEANAARWVAMSDEELWDFILEADIPRALNVFFGEGCPVHGKEVFQKGGHYPWIMSTDEPFKVKCPVGGEVYPSNDFAAYLEGGREEKLDTTQPYVDDGHGYVAPDGKRYWFVAHYVFWQRWRKDIFSAMDALNNAYLLTGDAQYAHKLGVMLGRLTEVYPKMDYARQAYHNGKYPAGIHGRILDYIWENGTIKRFARCYDGIYDAIRNDEPLKAFLADRGITDLKRDFEQKVLHFMARDVMEGRIRGNMYYQPTLATLAIVIDNDDPDYGPTTDQMVDWLLYGGGEIELILHNGFDRDGAGGESAPGYSSSWNTNFCNVAELLIRLGCDILDNPRWRQVIRFPYNVTIAGKYCPRIGDCHGNIHVARKLTNAPAFTFGYKHLRDPQCAQLLLTQDVFGESLWGETLDRADVEQVAQSAPDATDLRTRNLGGYGLAVFDAGEGDTRRAASLYYGSPEAWHGHHDRLTIGYYAHGRDFLTEMGYPAHWNDKGERFTRGMPCHYIVEIDQRRSANKKAGYLDFFAAGERTRVVRAHAEAIYPGLAQVYQRTLAMINSGDNSFLVDLFHVKGGALHDYHFHGLPFGEFTTNGLELVATQEKGTLLGEDLEWGGDTSKDMSGYDFLRNVRRYQAAPVWSARWAGRDDCRLAYYMPAFPEVIVCDGEPPHKPDYPETMEFVVVRNPASKSRFPAVIAPSRGADFITDVAFERADAETRYRVETDEGSWDITVNDDGGFSAILHRSDNSAYAFFANHAAIEFGGQQVRVERPAAFTIETIDYATNSVIVKETIADPQMLIGEVCVLRPPVLEGVATSHSASYTVAEADEQRLGFEGPATAGMIILEPGDDPTAAVTKGRLSGFGMQIASRSFIGMALVSEDLQQSAQVITYGSGEFGLASPIDFSDANNDGRRLAYLADFAPGYTVTFTPWLEIELAPDGALTTRSNSPTQVQQ